MPRNQVEETISLIDQDKWPFTITHKVSEGKGKDVYKTSCGEEVTGGCFAGTINNVTCIYCRHL